MSPPDNQVPLPDPAPQQTGFRKILTLFPSIVLPMFLAMIDQTIVATALPAIAGDLGGVNRISWVVISYLIAATIAAPVYGRLGDLLGRKWFMLIALTILMAASAICTVSQSLGMLIFGRTLQGLGGGGIMTLTQALIGEAVAPRERPRYQGFLAGTAVTSAALGPVLGGILTEHFGWRSIFLINLPIGLVALLLSLRLRARPGSGLPFRFDFVGLALFALFIASTLLMLEQIRGIADGPGLILTLLALSLAAVVTLVWHERRISHPLLPIELLRNPSIWRADALAACHGAVLVSLLTFVPILYRVVHTANLDRIGLMLIPMSIGIAVGSIVTGGMVSSTGRAAIFPSVGLTMVSSILIGLAIWSPVLGMTSLAWLLGVNALFMGTVMVVVQMSVQMAAGPTMLGTASASVQFSRSLGASLGTAIVGTVLFASMNLGDSEADNTLRAMLQQGPLTLTTISAERLGAAQAEVAEAFRGAFLTIAAFALGGLALACSLPLRRI